MSNLTLERTIKNIIESAKNIRAISDHITWLDNINNIKGAILSDDYDAEDIEYVTDMCDDVKMLRDIAGVLDTSMQELLSLLTSTREGQS